MFTTIKMLNCFGYLAVESNDLCPDNTIIVDRTKNGIHRVRIWDGPCEKPFIKKRFNSIEAANSFIDEFTSRKFAKIDISKFN